MEIALPHQLATLGHDGRLAIFRLLMRRYPDFVPAGEVSDALAFKANTASAYFAALLRAGLIEQRRAGTSIGYRIDMPGTQGMTDALLSDCCRGRPDLCLSNKEPLEMTDHPTVRLNVLFICTGNSARSIFAESILSDIAGDRFAAFSAGTRPTSDLNPLALKMLEEKGHDVTGLRSKNTSEFQSDTAPGMDFVFTVCDRAANEDCPSWTGQPISAHWGMADPVKAEGSDAQRMLAFQQAYGILANRIGAFANLPISTLQRASLQQAVDDIGQT